MLRQGLLAAAAVGAMMAAAPAEAVVTYTLVDQLLTVPNPGPPTFATAPFEFTISDAAVARGAIQVGGTGTGGFGTLPTLTGDVADFVSLFFIDTTVSAARIMGSFNLQATFAPDRSISSFNLALIGESDAFLSGSNGNLVSGPFGSERPDCNGAASTGLCRVSGRLVATVPEPMSLALLTVGLLGTLVLARRQL